MSEVKRHLVVAGSECSEMVYASDYDALAQRCRKLEVEIGQYRDITYASVDECAALRAEVADLKARLLEAERGAEELVRLRAERREMHDLLAETCKAYDEAIHLEDLRQALKRVKSALELAHD